MMKKTSYIFLFLITIVISMLAAGCRKAPINGKLDAQWQIMNIEHISDGHNEKPRLRTYIDINLHIVNLRNVTTDEKGGAVIAGNMIYDKDNSKLTLDFPYNKEGEKLTQLQSWGIYTNPITFDIVKLDGKQLVLKSEATVITCRRF